MIHDCSEKVKMNLRINIIVMNGEGATVSCLADVYITFPEGYLYICQRGPSRDPLHVLKQCLRLKCIGTHTPKHAHSLPQTFFQRCSPVQ